MQVNNYIDYNGKKLIIKRTVKEHQLKPGFDQQLLKEWKNQKKRFERILGAKVSNSQLLEWLIIEMSNAPDESYK